MISHKVRKEEIYTMDNPFCRGNGPRGKPRALGVYLEAFLENEPVDSLGAILMYLK